MILCSIESHQRPKMPPASARSFRFLSQNSLIPGFNDKNIQKLSAFGASASLARHLPSDLYQETVGFGSFGCKPIGIFGSFQIFRQEISAFSWNFFFLRAWNELKLARVKALRWLLFVKPQPFLTNMHQNQESSQEVCNFHFYRTWGPCP